MATTEADSEHGHDDHGHHGPKWLAHHFDTPEQQFDSGKLGIWLFLVTEVLFFSGMFCAYAMFRALRPEVFEGCSQFLNTKLGAINTGVLLFSSLTMAWAVRCSQTKEHKTLTGMLAATLSCAMIFLGVKAIEYSHKWSMGLLPAGMFTYDPAHPHIEGSPNYLAYICFPFAVALIGVLIWLVWSIVSKNEFHTACAKPLSVVCLSFFLGVGLGMFLESGGEESHDSHMVASVDGEHGGADSPNHGEDGEHEGHESTTHVGDTHSLVGISDADAGDLDVLERLATDATNTGLKDDVAARKRQQEMATGGFNYNSSDDASGTVTDVEREFLTPARAGVFFSIYYCMTGIHAIHILGGIGVLVWLLIRSVRQDFNPQYFGPVDYVGLYWHLVDLIWIYLFPLLYLIR